MWRRVQTLTSSSGDVGLFKVEAKCQEQQLRFDSILLPSKVKQLRVHNAADILKHH